jgi:proprotein convertase subtilisin/kexin type 5
VSQCPAGTTLIAGGLCQSVNGCTNPCTKCSESPSHCLACDPNSGTPALLGSTGTCLPTTCTDGYFFDGGSCVPCDSNCGTCSTSATNCDSCSQIHLARLLDERTNTCVETCAPDVAVLVSGVCRKCHVSCATCSDITAQGCRTCPETGTKYATADSECVSLCPNDTYHWDNADGTHACITKCDPGAFVDTGSRYCRPCDVSCNTCHNTAGACTSCDTTGATPYLTEAKTCVAKCADDLYTYELDGEMRCYETCPDSYGFESKEERTCVKTCPTGTFPKAGGTGSTCEYCHTTCAACFGELETNCSTCKD